jgi:hypothetical protein
LEFDKTWKPEYNIQIAWQKPVTIV